MHRGRRNGQPLTNCKGQGDELDGPLALSQLSTQHCNAHSQPPLPKLEVPTAAAALLQLPPRGVHHWCGCPTIVHSPNFHGQQDSRVAPLQLHHLLLQRRQLRVLTRSPGPQRWLDGLLPPLLERGPCCRRRHRSRLLAAALHIFRQF